MARVSRFSLGSWTRNSEGCIATFDHAGERWSRHFATAGYVQAIADYADAHGAKIVCLSTPETIHRDLQGTREDIDPYVTRQTRIEKQGFDRVAVPEVSILGRIGRTDLILGHTVRPKHV